MTLRTAAFLALAAISAPVAAQESDPLACMETGYSPEDQAKIDDYIANFTLDNVDGAKGLGTALGPRLIECVGQDADQATMIQILQHRFGAISIRAISTKRPDVAETVNRINTVLDAEKRERFLAIFRRMTLGNTAGDQTITAEEEEFFGDVLIAPPVNGTEEQAEMVGALLAAQMLQSDAVEYFSDK